MDIDQLTTYLCYHKNHKAVLEGRGFQPKFSIKKVELTGVEAEGAIEISYFYPGSNLSAVPEVSSIIPKIYR
jgi:hypothetical protein